MTITPHLSEDAKLYANTGTYDTPVWVEICNVMDLNFVQDATASEVTLRCSGGQRTYVPGLDDISIDFDQLYDPSDTDGWAYLNNLKQTKTASEFAVMDDDIAATGTEGWRGKCMVETFSHSQVNGDPIKTSVSLRPYPTPADEPSGWWSVA